MDATIVRVPTTQTEALAAARRLYDRLYRDLRAETAEDEWAALDAAYRSGDATLQTLELTAADLPLSADTQEMIAGYLEGPADDDAEGRRAWLVLLPELFVDIRRADEAEHASLLQAATGVGSPGWDDWSDLWKDLGDIESVASNIGWPSSDDWAYFGDTSVIHEAAHWSYFSSLVSHSVLRYGSQATDAVNARQNHGEDAPEHGRSGTAYAVAA